MEAESGSAEIDRIVLYYLNKKGYKTAELALKNEAKVGSIEEIDEEITRELDASISSYILFHQKEEAMNPAIYEQSYSKLKRWIEDSLDLYKGELYLLLYPLFVHCYLELIGKGFQAEAKRFFDAFKADHTLEHESDMRQLIGITDSHQMQENGLSSAFLQNKYSLKLCNYSFDLFIAYLQDNKMLSLLKIVNRHLNIRVYVGSPRAENAEAYGITGYSMEIVNSMNSESILWGVLSSDSKMNEEVERLMKEQALKNNQSADEAQRMIEYARRMNPLFHEQSPKRDRIPLPGVKKSEVVAELKKIQDTRHRLPLGPSVLPSICCYTFYNTYDTLNSIQFSNDSTLMSCGYSDSYIEVCSLTNHKLRGLKPSVEIGTLTVTELMDLDLLKEQEGSEVKKLVGHSGPVYSTAFTPNNRFLLSCSQDGTARLWSLDTFSNLVCYKGHNYPVWDLSISPLGLYFATASNDRTARLWSFEHVHPLRIFAGHLSDVDCVQFHPNCNYVATGSADKSVRLWDVQTGRCVRLFTGHTAPVSSLAISPDGKYLASGSQDNSVRVWNLDSGSLLKSFTGHENMIYLLDFSKDGSILASGSNDMSVRLWDVKTDSLDALAVFKTKQTPVYKIHFSWRNLLMVGGAFNT